MTDVFATDAIREIVYDEFFPHDIAIIWKALTSTRLIERWLMKPEGFFPVEGNRFTFQTKPAGEWDGTIHCEILEVVEPRRLVYSWRGGHERNQGYGSRLDTRVTWSLAPAEGGTRVRLVHSGFRMPENETALTNMGSGWKTVLSRLETVAAEKH